MRSVILSVNYQLSMYAIHGVIISRVAGVCGTGHAAVRRRSLGDSPLKAREEAALCRLGRGVDL